MIRSNVQQEEYSIRSGDARAEEDNVPRKCISKIGEFVFVIRIEARRVASRQVPTSIKRWLLLRGQAVALCVVYRLL
jgi:hypothetical protein